MDVAVLFQISWFRRFTIDHFDGLDCFEAFAFFLALARSLHMMANGKGTEREEFKVNMILFFISALPSSRTN